VVERSETPLIFVVEASYTDGDNRTRTAFSPGQLLARHGSKTEPAGGEDLRRMMRDGSSERSTRLRRLERIRDLLIELEASLLDYIGGSKGMLSVTLVQDRLRAANEEFGFEFTNVLVAATNQLVILDGLPQAKADVEVRLEELGGELAP
jgi:hypothetical protein